MSYKKEYELIEKINKMYEERLNRAVNGQDSDRNDIEMEILYIMYASATERIKENHIPKEIVDAWLSVQLHYILLDIRNEKVKDTVNDEFDAIANKIYLDVVSN